MLRVWDRAGLHIRPFLPAVENLRVRNFVLLHSYTSRDDFNDKDLFAVYDSPLTGRGTLSADGSDDLSCPYRVSTSLYTMGVHTSYTYLGCSNAARDSAQLANESFERNLQFQQ